METMTRAFNQQAMADTLSALFHQLPDSEEAMDIWQEIIAWAEEFYRQRGRPATLDDLYQELPDLDYLEDLYDERRE